MSTMTSTVPGSRPSGSTSDVRSQTEAEMLPVGGFAYSSWPCESRDEHTASLRISVLTCTRLTARGEKSHACRRSNGFLFPWRIGRTVLPAPHPTSNTHAAPAYDPSIGCASAETDCARPRWRARAALGTRH